jgi:hypothetical protein
MSHLSDIQPGQVIGRYEFLAPIAQGGMAAVWAARQRGSHGFSKFVAIKTMLPTISDDPRFERMFLDEAKIASRIHHPNVVEILDLGEENEILYLVMEWVDGESLSALRRRAAERDGIPLRLALRIVASVCAGLHSAHELVDDDGRSFGLVHRDVSPQNVLVGYDGNVKILDFGVAKIAGRTTDTTNIGHARGKPPYMAPEQALGREIDRRADVFSLGVILYQLLVGRHPFRGENDIATLHNIISDQAVVPPSNLVPSISRPIEAIALRALEREPQRRFQTAQEFELALEAVLHSNLGRVRSEEIGRLMLDAFGTTREQRRGAIREAVHRADGLEPTRTGVALSALPAEFSAVGEPLGDTYRTHDKQAAAKARESGADNSPAASVASRILASDEKLGDSTASVRRDSSVARGWWRVLAAMGIGAGLTWMWLSVLDRTSEQPGSTEPSTSLADSMRLNLPTLDSSVPVPETNRGDLPPSSAISSGDKRDSRRVVAPHRMSTSGNRSATGGAVNQRHGLPPIPSPGF